jgi:hypothetical protein
VIRNYPMTRDEVLDGVDLRLLKAQLRTLGAAGDPRTKRINAKQREHLDGVWHFLGLLYDALEAERKERRR